MKTSGYKFGNKNNYRRWVWNRIHEQVKRGGKHPKDCLVIYLPAEEDLDRGIALEHGFTNSNLIGVDRSPAVVSTIRGRGHLCISGDLYDVFPQIAYKADVVLADYCCGFTGDTSALAVYAPSLCRPGTIIATNLLRGRDDMEIGTDPYGRLVPGMSARLHAFGPLHRGGKFFDMHLSVALNVALRSIHPSWYNDNVVIQRGERVSHFVLPDTLPSAVQSTANDVLDTFREFAPAFFSYMSGVQVFDSVVLTCAVGTRVQNDSLVKRLLSDSRSCGSVAAVFAHRTRRLCA